MTQNFGKGVLRKLRSFARDSRGLSAMEFAFVFPVMAALYLGGSALTQGIVIKRKMTLATRTAGDLTSQDSCISDAEMNNIFIAATTVIQPYSAQSMTLTITSVKTDNKGNGTVDWSSKSQNGGTTEPGRKVGDPVTLPDGVNAPNVYVIMAEGLYNYVPTWGQDYISQLPLSETFYLRPRRVNQITRQSTTCSS